MMNVPADVSTTACFGEGVCATSGHAKRTRRKANADFRLKPKATEPEATIEDLGLDDARGVPDIVEPREKRQHEGGIDEHLENDRVIAAVVIEHRHHRRHDVDRS